MDKWLKENGFVRMNIENVWGWYYSSNGILIEIVSMNEMYIVRVATEDLEDDVWDVSYSTHASFSSFRPYVEYTLINAPRTNQ